VFFDSETRLTYLRGWSILSGGKDYEVKEKDAVETSASEHIAYLYKYDIALASELELPDSLHGNDERGAQFVMRAEQVLNLCHRSE
jgi:hypothetical protein